MIDVLIVIPVDNERIALEGSVRRLQRAGLRIYEVPVDWVEDTDSRVRIASTALADLRGVARLALHRHSSQTPTLLSPNHPMLAR